MGMFDRTFRKPSDNDKKDWQEGKIKRFIHSPTTTEINGTKVSIAEDGKIIIIQEGKDELGDFHDEVKLTAKMIYQIKDLIEATRRVKWIDVGETNKDI